MHPKVLMWGQPPSAVQPGVARWCVLTLPAVR